MVFMFAGSKFRADGPSSEVKSGPIPGPKGINRCGVELNSPQNRLTFRNHGTLVVAEVLNVSGRSMCSCCWLVEIDFPAAVAE